MKRVFLAVTALLSISAAFVSCGDKELFDQGAVEQANVLEAEKQYKENFVKRFGEVAPDQTWDFSQINYPMAEQNAQTRSWLYDMFHEQLPAPTWNERGILSSLFDALINDTDYPNVNTDEAEVKKLVETMPVVDWPYDYAQINLHPFYSKGTSDNNYYYLGVKYQQKDYTGTYNDFNGLCLKAKKNEWSSIVTNSSLLTEMNMNSYASVNTSNMNGVAGFQWFVACSNTPKIISWPKDKKPLEKCKLFYVNGHTYVALDCNGDNKYDDMICWVEDCSPAKRYMVEDLGANDDFDFNDIVFDVVWNENLKKYECIVRAMGGTLDFTIKVANTTWTKSTAKNGKYNKYTIYNTTDGDYNLDEEYDRFVVDNWHPEENDVTVTVEGNNGRFVLPFPEEGEIPYMIATSIGKAWAKERINVETIGWFGSVQNDGKIEVVEE